MEGKLTPLQQQMIGLLNKDIEKTKRALEKATEKERPNLELRLKMLEEQLTKASTPFKRTAKEIELIDKIVNKVKENTSTVAGNKIDGDRSDKPLTPKENFKYAVEMYIKEVGNRIEPMKKELTAQEHILTALRQSAETVTSEDVAEVYKREIEIKENMVSQLRLNIKLFEERLELKDSGVFDWAMEHYEGISKLNILLNDPLKLPDFEEYLSCRKKEFNVK